jgi:hypothetical protein
MLYISHCSSSRYSVRLVLTDTQPKLKEYKINSREHSKEVMSRSEMKVWNRPKAEDTAKKK